MPLVEGVPSRRPLVACAARLEPVKGVEFLLRAATSVPDAAFAIAGDGSQAGYLRELAFALGIDGRVAFLGMVMPVAPLLAAADVVVLPSLSEGMPIAALEAMALGTPVIASRVGGLPEIVSDGVCGLLVPPGEPNALAAAINAVIGDPETSQLMGEACKRAVRQKYTSARMAQSYVSLVAELAGGPGTHSL
jgi:glycosyltransferase involved in cell wall biosynthesis